MIMHLDRQSFFTEIARFLCIGLMIFPAAALGATPDWTRTARLAGSETLSPDLSDAEIAGALDEHHAQNVSVLLIWADEEQAYKLAASRLAYLKTVATKAHAYDPPMRVVLYLAPLEQISSDVDMNKDGKVDPGKHSVYSDHPGWVQVGIDGRPAVFYGAIAFWVGPHDEDAWTCPNDPEWRALEIAGFQKIGETGIDGVWWDRPEFMSDLGTSKWQRQWACHCSDCKAAFRRDKSAEIPPAVDFSNKTWRDWIEWRFEKMGRFIADCRTAARKKNPNFVLFNEFYDRTDWYTTEAGFSDLRTRGYHDGVAHEWGTRDPPSKYKNFDWKADIATYRAYRGFDRDHPSWVLAYSQSVENAKTLASGQLLTGCNFYEVKYYQMVPSVNKEFRRQIFSWIRDNEELYYASDLKPFANVALYYSDPSVHWIDAPSRGNDDFFEEFNGLGILFGELHVSYCVIGPHRLSELGSFDAVVLPNAASMSDSEAAAFNDYVKEGGVLISTAETSLYDSGGQRRSDYALKDVFGANYPVGGVVVHPYGSGLSVFSPDRWGQEYFAAVKPGSPKTNTAREKSLRADFAREVWTPAGVDSQVSLAGHEWLATEIYYTNSKVILRVANYKNIKAPSQRPAPDNNVTTDLRLPDGFTPGRATVTELLGAARSQSFSLPRPGWARVTFSVKNHVVILFEE
ncbi:MAG: hypothetical protein AB1714_29070 [Acidobacteriota bacterium]